MAEKTDIITKARAVLLDPKEPGVYDMSIESVAEADRILAAASAGKEGA